MKKETEGERWLKQVEEIKERGRLLPIPRLSRNGGKAAHNKVGVRLTGARRLGVKIDRSLFHA